MSLTRMPSGTILFNSNASAPTPADVMLNAVLVGDWSAVVDQAKLDPDLLFVRANSGDYRDLTPLECAVIMGHSTLLDDLHALSVTHNFCERLLKKIKETQDMVEVQKKLLVKFLKLSERYAASSADDAACDELFESWRNALERIQAIPVSYRESLLNQVRIKSEVAASRLSI